MSKRVNRFGLGQASGPRAIPRFQPYLGSASPPMLPDNGDLLSEKLIKLIDEQEAGSSEGIPLSVEDQTK